MELPAHIAHLLNELTQFMPKVAAKESANRVEVEDKKKRVEVLWPNHAGEVFFDFVEEGLVLLSESVEYYDEEAKNEQAEEIAEVVRRFLLHEVRVTSVGHIFKRQELQINQDGRWLYIFQSPAQ